MNTKNWDEFLKTRFTKDEIKEIKRRAKKDVFKLRRPKMTKYNILFYTIEDIQNCAEPSYNIEDVTAHDIDIIDTLIDNDKEHNFAHFDGNIIDLNKFAVIQYEEVEEDEE